MKHVVFIVGSYYPYYSAVGKCLGNIAAEFEKDYKVTVICEKNIVEQSDEDVLNSQKIYRVTTKMHYRRIKVDEDLKNARGVSKRVGKLKLIMCKLERYVKMAISGSACDKDVIGAYLKALNDLETTADIIIPTCNQFESIAAALLYKEDKNSQVQIVPYLFDVFAENVNINRGERLLKRHWKANMEYEEKMFNESEAIFHVANWTNHVNRYFSEYKYKTHEVEHPLLVLKDIPSNEADSDCIHVVYTGVVDKIVRNPQKALDVINQITLNKVKFDFYSFGSGENIVESFSSKNKAIIAHGQVDSASAEAARRNANILLSIGNADNSQMPSKLIEYIASGKPIIHFAQSQNDPSIKLLRKYPLSKIINVSSDYSVNDIELFIQEERYNRLSFDVIKELFFDANPGYIANEISKNFGGGGIE